MNKNEIKIRMKKYFGNGITWDEYDSENGFYRISFFIKRELIARFMFFNEKIKSIETKYKNYGLFKDSFPSTEIILLSDNPVQESYNYLQSGFPIRRFLVCFWLCLVIAFLVRFIIISA